MSSPAEPIARVVDDLRKGRVRHQTGSPTVNATALQRVQAPQPVVDCTAIYRDLYHRLCVQRKAVDVYGDHPSIAPPWSSALFGYVNEHSNVVVLSVHAQPWDATRQWETPNPVDWWRVRWLVETFMFVGGRSDTTGADVHTSGPVHLLQYAVYGDGEPADLHYVQLLPDAPLDTWEIPQLTLLASLNFLGCKNVDIAEPARPRPERRRLARLGVDVQAIVVRPIGKRTRSARPGEASGEAVPLTSVRGRFNHYGPAYGKGLLFGKLAGKFWVPAHARGSAEHGGGERDYVLKPASEAVA